MSDNFPYVPDLCNKCTSNFASFIPVHAASLCISILWVCMSLTDGVALATASRMGSNSWQCSPAGLCLVSICWGLKRGRKETDQPCRQKDRMGEQEEESGRTWLAALTLIEAGEIGGWLGGGCGGGGSALMLESCMSSVKKKKKKEWKVWASTIRSDFHPCLLWSSNFFFEISLHNVCADPAGQSKMLFHLCLMIIIMFHLLRKCKLNVGGIRNLILK